MALPDFTASRLGQADGAGDADALFLKVWGGEVFVAFRNATKTMDKHLVRTIASGKSAQFPVLGKGSASYHTPGTMIDGTAVLADERVITIDDKLIAPRFIADIDEAKNHYEVRAEYTKDMGDALAQKWDINVFNSILLAARASATVSGEDGGTVITSASAGTDASALRAAIFDARQSLEEKNVPTGSDVWAYLKPSQYFNLIDDPKLVNRDYTSGSNGGVDSGEVFRVAGIPLVMSNNVPTSDMSADTDLLSKYRVNAATTVGLVATRQAVGTVKLMDLKFESERSIMHQGFFMIASYAVGSGILRPECAVEIKTS
jgi:hypothetical protein